MADLSLLEPMAGAGLAISLAYLALERFRYRRDVENEAASLHEKYENDAKLSDDETLEHLQELKWLCRKECNGHVPSGAYAVIYRLFYRRHGDVWGITALAALSAIILVMGVAGAIGVVGTVESSWIVNLAFYVCFAAMSLPAIGVLAGRWCRDWGMKRAQKCDDQIAHALKLSAQTATAPHWLDPDYSDETPPF